MVSSRKEIGGHRLRSDFGSAPKWLQLQSDRSAKPQKGGSIRRQVFHVSFVLAADPIATLSYAAANTAECSKATP
jgi:hypothetical protein